MVDYDAVSGPVDARAYVKSKTPDSGYFGLADGSVVLQIGACTAATQDLTQCDGAGAVQEIRAGDRLSVYEVDTTYLASCNSAKQWCGPQTGNAESGCLCLAEPYNVLLRSAGGKFDTWLGNYVGTNPNIDVDAF